METFHKHSYELDSNVASAIDLECKAQTIALSRPHRIKNTCYFKGQSTLRKYFKICNA